MELIKFSCLACSTDIEIEDYIIKSLPEFDIICTKCNAKIKTSTMNVEQIKIETVSSEKEEDMSEHPNDPRTDLKEDTKIWKTLLSRLWKINPNNKELYYAFHGLRCGSSRLAIIDNKVDFTFGDDFTKEQISNIKEKYLNPNRTIIELVMKRLEKDLNKIKTLEDCPF
jgi:hypothetical protein